MTGIGDYDTSAWPASLHWGQPAQMGGSFNKAMMSSNRRQLEQLSINFSRI